MTKLDAAYAELQAARAAFLAKAAVQRPAHLYPTAFTR